MNQGELPMMSPVFKRFLMILILYFIIDLSYQIAFGMRFLGGLYAQAGLSDIMNKGPAYFGTVPLFFIGIAFVLSRLVVEPAVAASSPRMGFVNGALIGLAVYGTLALVFLWQIKGFPPLAGLGFLLEGLLFPTLSSGLTVWWTLRKRRE